MPETPPLPMQFGVPLDQSSLIFFACLIAAIGLVYFFCRKNFGERISGNSDYVYQLLPRHLATKEEYSKGFMVYFGTMAVTVILLSLIGPKNLAALGIPIPPQVGYVIVPLAIAFLWVGVLPTVPGLLVVEKYLRQYAQEQAYIPASALATADRLAAADFDFSAYAGTAVLRGHGVVPADFTGPRRSIEHDWARLCCLVYELKSRRMAGLLEQLDAEVLRSYEQDLEAIETKQKAMVPEMAAYRAEKERNADYTNDELWRAIRNNLYRLYILLGCAVRLKLQPYQDVNVPLKQFGFKLNAWPRQRSDDLKLVGIAIVAISVLAVDFVAVFLAEFTFWDLSPVFPQKYFQPFIDTVSTLIPFGAAMVTADVMRKRGIKRGWWQIAPRTVRPAINGTYIRVAVVGAIVGYICLLLWGLAFQAPTLKGFMIEAPNMLLAMIAGGFYVFHLDNVETNSRPPRAWEVGGQAALTALCGLLAAAASWEIILGSAGLALDRILLNAVICGMIGFSLGWYIPKVAAAAKYDPQAEAHKERVQSLEVIARERFGDAAEARIWLETTHPALDNSSPRQAAETVEGYEHAVSLLRHPRSIAA